MCERILSWSALEDLDEINKKNMNPYIAHLFSLLLLWVTVASHSRSDGIQYASEALREHDLVELARLVYRAEPGVVRAALGSLLEMEMDEEKASNQMSKMVTNLEDRQAAADDPISCQACKDVVGPMKGLCVTEEVLTNVLIKICLNISVPLGINGEILCPGTLNLQMPHVCKVLRARENTAADVCQFLNLCFPDPAAAMDGNAVRRAVRGSAPLRQEGLKRLEGAPRVTPPENSITVIQLTDIHLEPKYATGTNTDCGLPVCCVPDYGPGYSGKFGDYKCNIPRSTAAMFAQKALSLAPSVVLFSGDVPPHSVWEETVQSQKQCSEILVEVLNETMPDHSVYPNIGNHEGYPTNLFSKGSLNYTQGFLSWYADLWRSRANFSEADENHILAGGFYSKLVYAGLRLISFNTNYMYTFNWYNVENHRSGTLPPSDSEYNIMIKFVEDELRSARENNEKVILMGHHPPGGADYIIKGSRWYRKTVLQYHDIIVLQPTGHTHYDEFRMIYDDTGAPLSVVLVAPSMSTGGSRNPSMRVFYLDKDSKELIDYDHYFLDIGPVLNNDELPEDWSQLITRLYSAREEYGMSDLTPASWNDLLNRFETDTVLLNKHRAHSKADAENAGLCLGRCQNNYICRQRHVNYDEYKNCTVDLSDIDWGWVLNQTRPTNPPTTPSNASFNQSAHQSTLIFLILTLTIVLIM